MQYLHSFSRCICVNCNLKTLISLNDVPKSAHAAAAAAKPLNGIFAYLLAFVTAAFAILCCRYVIKHRQSLLLLYVSIGNFLPLSISCDIMG
jgi:hypothetical protein